MPKPDITPPREDLDKSLHGLELQAPTFDPALYEDTRIGSEPLCPPEPIDFSL